MKIRDFLGIPTLQTAGVQSRFQSYREINYSNILRLNKSRNSGLLIASRNEVRPFSSGIRAGQAHARTDARPDKNRCEFPAPKATPAFAAARRASASSYLFCVFALQKLYNATVIGTGQL